VDQFFCLFVGEEILVGHTHKYFLKVIFARHAVALGMYSIWKNERTG